MRIAFMRGWVLHMTTPCVHPCFLAGSISACTATFVTLSTSLVGWHQCTGHCLLLKDKRPLRALRRWTRKASGFCPRWPLAGFHCLAAAPQHSQVTPGDTASALGPVEASAALPPTRPGGCAPKLRPSGSSLVEEPAKRTRSWTLLLVCQESAQASSTAHASSTAQAK